MVNIEKLQMAVKQIEAEPERWKQSDWRTQVDDQEAQVTPDSTTDPAALVVDCHTAFCLAGIACQYLDDEGPAAWLDEEHLLARAGDHLPKNVRTNSPISAVTAHHRAMRLFDIDSDQARYLFDGGRTLQEIKFYIQALKQDQEST